MWAKTAMTATTPTMMGADDRPPSGAAAARAAPPMSQTIRSGRFIHPRGGVIYRASAFAVEYVTMNPPKSASITTSWLAAEPLKK